MPTADQISAWFDAHGFKVVVVLLSGLITWELLTGVARGKRWAPVSREDNPTGYWFLMLSQAAVLAVLVMVFKDRPLSSGKVRESAQESSAESPAPVVPDSPHVLQRRAAYDLHRAGNYAAAIPLYDSVLANRASDSEVLFFRGVAHWRTGRNDLALTDFLRVAALDDTNFTANQYADRIMSSQARWDELIVMWGKFIEKNPDNARAYFERGGTWYHKGDRTAARADITKACAMQLADACNQKARLGW